MFIVSYKVKILYTLYIYDLLRILVSLSQSYGSMEYLCVCVCVCERERERVCVCVCVCVHAHDTYIYLHTHMYYQVQCNQSVMPISEVKEITVTLNIGHQNL